MTMFKILSYHISQGMDHGDNVQKTFLSHQSRIMVTMFKRLSYLGSVLLEKGSDLHQRRCRCDDRLPDMHLRLGHIEVDCVAGRKRDPG